jgi:hypothetical protein
MARQEKTRICIRIDSDLLARFQTESAQSAHPIAYQTLINKALRRFIETEEGLQHIIIRELPSHEPKRMRHAHEIALPAPRKRGRPRSSPPADWE